MRQFTLELNKNIQRPVIKLTDWHQYDVMLDTGALFPVWVDDEATLIAMGSECIKDSVEFSGIGGKANGKLYRLPYLKIGDLIYPGLPIIAYQIEIPCQMLLSATMFSHLRYEVDDENHCLNVTVPDSQSCVRNLTIKDENGHLQVLCTSGDENLIDTAVK